MSARQYNKYLWLLNKIHSAGERGITFKEIEAAWVNATINDNHQSHLPRSTFNDWKTGIAELLGYEITVIPGTFRYRIPSEDWPIQLTPEQRMHLEIANQVWSPVVSPLFVEQIHIRTLTETAKNLRVFPLNESQRELETESNHYCEFEILMAPSIQLFFQLRSLGSEIEVLRPMWLRELMWDEAITNCMAYSEGLTIADDEDPNLDIYADIDARKCRVELVEGEPQPVFYQRLEEDSYNEILAAPEEHYLTAVCWPKNARFFLESDVDGRYACDEEGHHLPVPFRYARISTGLGQLQRFALLEITDVYLQHADQSDGPELVCYNLGRVVQTYEPRYKR